MGCVLMWGASWALVAGAVLLGLGFPQAAMVVACVGAVTVAGVLEKEG